MVSFFSFFLCPSFIVSTIQTKSNRKNDFPMATSMICRNIRFRHTQLESLDVMGKGKRINKKGKNIKNVK